MLFNLSKRFRLLCRVAAIFALGIAFCSGALLVLTDDTIASALSEFERGQEVFVGTWRILASGLLMLEWALRLLLFGLVARLLWILSKGDIFTRPAAKAALRVGQVQLVFGVIMWIKPTLMRLLNGLGYRKIEVSLSMSGAIASALLFGFVLILLAKAYEGAVYAVEENRQFI